MGEDYKTMEHESRVLVRRPNAVEMLGLVAIPSYLAGLADDVSLPSQEQLLQNNL